MRKFINRLSVLLLGSFFMVASLNAGAYSEDFFDIKVKTDNTGSSDDNQFTLPINPEYTYNSCVVTEP